MSYTDFNDALASLAISLDRAGSRWTIDHEDNKDPAVPTGSIFELLGSRTNRN